MCGNTYYEYFMIGCMAQNNTKEVCEQATDAGDTIPNNRKVEVRRIMDGIRLSALL